MSELQDLRPTAGTGETWATTRPASSIRALLLQLMVAALVPTIALLAYSGYASYQQARQQAQQSAYALAQLAADSVQAFLEDTRMTMAQLARRPDIQAMDPAHCDGIFRDFKDLLPRFANFSQASLNGELICSSGLQPGGQRTSISQTAWYRQIVQTQRFVVAPPYLGPVTGKVVSVLAYPVKDAEGRLRGSIQLPVDLAGFQPVAGSAQLPETTVITIIDSTGTIVARSREAARFIGRNLSSAPSISGVLKRHRGTMVNVTSEGVERFFGFMEIPGTDWYAVAGIASDTVLGPARQAALRDASIATAICIFAVGLALRGRRRIVQPIDALRDTALRIGAGELGLRASTKGPEELAAVAGAFNSMMDASATESRALARSEAEFRLLFESSLEGILRSRVDGTVLLANPTASSLLGITPDDFGHCRWHDRVAPGDERLAVLLASVQEDSNARGELALLRSDGSRVDCAVSLTSVGSSDGQVELNLFLNDLSDRTQKEEMRISKEAAERASREKSAFLARMSHELRTPLNAILGFGQLLAYDHAVAVSEKTRQMVEHVQSAGAHLLALIDDVLDLSRIEAGALSLSLEPVEIEPLLRECVDMMADAAAAGGIQVRIENSTEPDAGAGWVHADVTRLRQVLVNVLGNAIKYNRAGGQVHVRIINDTSTVRVAISDTGGGLDVDQQAALFQPFNRVGAERSAVQGTGLGLVIVQRLLTAMQADIAVESRVGVGSTFTLSFSRAPATRAPDVAQPLAAPEALQLRTGCSGRLLYIEDHEPNVVLMSAVMAWRPNVRFETAVDGTAGINAARRLRPDIVFLDINLPDIDGYEVLRQLRADPATAAIPCIAISAFAMLGDAEAALAAGFQGYVVKPFKVKEILARVDQWLG